MSEPILQSVAASIEAARAVFAKAQRWPDLGVALSRLLLIDACIAPPDGLGDPPSRITADTLRRSPELACLGYRLSEIDDRGVHEAWLAGFSRLMQREVYPADRDSFAHEPLELIGLAKGLSHCAVADDEQRHWLSAQLDQGLREHQIATGLPELSARFARLVTADTHIPAAPVLNVGMMPTEDLCILYGLARFAPNWLADLNGPLEETLVRRALETDDTLYTPLQAGVFQVVLQRAIDRFAIRAVASNPVDAIVSICRRLPFLIEQLQNRQQRRPALDVTDEYDIQDLLHGLLRLHFDDVRPEENTPSYAGKSSRLDFFLPRERIIVEAKMTRRNLRGKEVADQLIIDKERYRSQPGVDSLICVVYDPGRHCSNPVGLEMDLSRSDPSLRVVVVITPHGI